MPTDDDNHEIVKRPPPPSNPPLVQGQPVRSLRLGQQEELDLSNLTDREAGEIEAYAHKKTIDRDDRLQRLKEDLTVTAAQIQTFTKAVGDTNAQNASVTITNTKDDSLGRTEMIFGNTDAARAGKLSRSQTGLGDNAKVWILLAIILGAVIVLVAAFKH